MSAIDRTSDWGKGSLRATMMGPHTLRFVLSGLLTEEGARQIVAATTAALEACGTVHVFHDWEAVANYDTSARKELTAYVDSVKDRISSSHILVRSSLVAMGVSVANVVLRQRLVAYSRRDRFEAALKQSVEDGVVAGR